MGARTVEHVRNRPILRISTHFSAAVSLLFSVWLFFGTGQKLEGLFVATWVPAILAFGVFEATIRRGGGS